MTSRVSETVVAIIGAGITGLSVASRLEQYDIPFIILEKSDKTGGQIRTCKKNGYTFETGPNTGMISTPEVAELFEYVQPEVRMETAKKISAARWIWKGNKFHPLPSDPISGLKSPLFTLNDKIGILFEPFRKKGNNPLESVGDLATRRLGKSFVDYAVDPFIGGIYAGDPFRLTTQYALPKLYALEQKYGSFIKGAVKKRKEPKSPRERKTTKEIFSAEGGLENLIKGLEKKISRTGTIVCNIEEITSEQSDNGNWLITYRQKGDSVRKVCVKHIVTTIRAYELETVLSPNIRPYLPSIASLTYAPVIEINVGFDHLPGISRNAFGGLVPSCENRKILGILFPSSCFDNRTPYADSALFTVFMGGIRQGYVFNNLNDDDIIEMGMNELYEMLKIPRNVVPDLIHISRYEKGIPQYEISSAKRVKKITEIQEKFKGMHIAGGISQGIGLADRITQGIKIGNKIARQVKHDI